jgi:hypothetical protein
LQRIVFCRLWYRRQRFPPRNNNPRTGRAATWANDLIYTRRGCPLTRLELFTSRFFSRFFFLDLLIDIQSIAYLENNNGKQSRPVASPGAASNVALGQKLPRRSLAGAAAVPPIRDAKTIALLGQQQKDRPEKRCGRLLGESRPRANPVWGRGGVGT